MDDAKADVTMGAIRFLAIGVFAFVVSFFEKLMFTIIGENITFNLRNDLYESLVNKDPDFFNDSKNSPGMLSSALSKDCLIVNAIISTSYAAIVKGIGSLICGITIAFVSSWRIAIIGLIGCPLIVITGFIESKINSG